MGLLDGNDILYLGDFSDSDNPTYYKWQNQNGFYRFTGFDTSDGSGSTINIWGTNPDPDLGTLYSNSGGTNVISRDNLLNLAPRYTEVTDQATINGLTIQTVTTDLGYIYLRAREPSQPTT